MRPKARIIVSIDSLTALSNGEGPELFDCEQIERVFRSAVSGLSQHKIDFETEVEFVVLAQSDHHPQESFRKEFQDAPSKQISYSELETILKSKDSTERPYNKTKFFWEIAKPNARALISPGNESIRRIIERGKALDPKSSSYHAEVEKSLFEIYSFFAIPNLKSLDEKAEKARKLMVECLDDLKAQKSPQLMELCQALEEASNFFSEFPMVLNAEEINLIDETQETIPTLLLLSSQTKIFGKLKGHFHLIRSHRSGEPSSDNLTKLRRLLEEYKFERITVYPDFDGTLLPDMRRYDPKHETNAEIAAILNEIKAEKAVVESRLLTSRLPFHQLLKNYLESILQNITQLKKFELSVNPNSLAEEIKEIQQECKALAEKKLNDLHEEIEGLKRIFEKMRKFIDIESLLGIPSTKNQEENPEFKDICKLIQYYLNIIFDIIESRCVSKFTKKYLEKHGLLIDINNERHLATIQTDIYKVDYIIDKHKNDKEFSLIVLVDDNPMELKKFSTKTNRPSQPRRAPGDPTNFIDENENVLAFSIKIHHEGCIEDKDNMAAFFGFLKDLEESLSKYESPRLVESGNQRLFAKRSSTSAIMPRPESNPQVSENTSVITSETAIIEYQKNSHNLILRVFKCADFILVIVQNLKTGANEKFTLSGNMCISYDNVEFSRTESGQLHMEDKDEPAARSQSNLGLQ